MANEPVNTPIQTKYTQQLTADLSANQAEQTTLTARLNQLQAEEKWLTTALESLQTTDGPEPTRSQGLASPVSSAVQAEAGADEAAVPKPRAPKKAEGTASVRKTIAGKSAAETAPARKSKASQKTAVNRAKEKAKPAEPTLGQLLTQILSKQPGEPKKVSEIRIELEAAHPQRTSSDPAIRAALEKLVTKGVLEKDNRQRIVLYTWPAQASAPASQTKPEQPATEPSEAASVGV
ncbi:hypothetical protein K7B10_37965 [Streptomyces flavotricini]|uniref:Regulatory protein n=1 Tax=Streptomyces flavotricini TaxID=66888 RepID=A0ABS8EH33_9ACTN|nr:hypothetical protein [Streptomyces flavotricini]MCC0100460.1 hypothetical protein [Streptomyces flavotricini]